MQKTQKLQKISKILKILERQDYKTLVRLKLLDIKLKQLEKNLENNNILICLEKL